MAAEEHRMGHNEQTDISRFWAQRSRKVGKLLGDTL